MTVIFPEKRFGMIFYRAGNTITGERGKLRFWLATALNDADAMEASDDEQ